MTQAELIQQQSRCIAHEIRNHISICDVYTEIIKKHLQNSGIENPSIDSAIGCISKSLKVMSNSLLDLKSLGELKVARCDLRELLLQAAEMSRVYGFDKKISISVDASFSVEVEIDENKFIACVVNLIKNAIESIAVEGFVEISLSVENDFASIKVANNGSMISMEKQAQIFEEGFTTKKTGSGLGLFICKNNLLLQNAQLSLVQSDEKLTVFEITVPVI